MWYSEKGKWFELFCRVCLYTLQCAVKELHLQSVFVHSSAFSHQRRSDFVSMAYILIGM
jgi:hypothetical protein